MLNTRAETVMPPILPYYTTTRNAKIKIAQSVDRGRILIRILVTCLYLQRTKNYKQERLLGVLWVNSATF